MDSNAINSILVIASDSETRRMFERLRESSDFRIALEEGGERGTQIAKETRPSAIVIDFPLPDVDSVEVCRMLRADPDLIPVPIIMLIPAEHSEIKLLALEAGADDFIRKPFDDLDLRARLKSIARLRLYTEVFTDLKRFAWMVDHASEGYLMLTEEGAILYANDRAAHLLNLPHDPTELNFMEIAEREYIPRPPEVWETWLDDPAECFLMRPETKQAHPVWIVLEALDTDVGREHHRVVRLRDVTEKMSIYQDIRKFHNAVSHKLRTPVSVMSGSLSLINSRLDRIPPEEVKNMMVAAGKSAERLVSEVRDILTYIDAPLAAKAGDPARLEKFSEIIDAVRARLDLKSVTFSMPSRYALYQLWLTSIAFELIMDELLENCKKFHPTHDPHVDISVGVLEPGFVNVRVMDNGVHLSAEQLAWAWLPYFQGEKDFTGELPGMGLGFPLVATLIWQAGGKLRLSNRTDAPGVIVEMSLPIRDVVLDQT
jgi:CheY-like chemotaxis protein/signal transduction histidine kinase